MDMGNEPKIEGVTFSEDIQSIFDNNCTSGCHEGVNATGGLKLTKSKSYVSLIYIPSSFDTLLLVQPWNADNSALYLKVIGDSRTETEMPLGGSGLSDVQISNIRIWIDEGAENN